MSEAFSNAVEFSAASKWLLFLEGKEFDAFLLLDHLTFELIYEINNLYFYIFAKCQFNMLNQAGNIVIATI